MKIKLLSSILLLTTLEAQTLQTTLKEVLSSNPIVQERHQNFQVEKDDIKSAKSGYYPSLDFNFGMGFEHTEKSDLASTPDNATYDYNVYQGTLKYTQNLFNGFATTFQLKEQKAKTLAAAYSYLETVNSLSYDTVNAYLEVLKNQELLKNSQENVTIDEEILGKVRKLYKAGLTTLSEVNKIESSLALAQANLIVQENNALSSIYKLQNIIGKEVDIQTLQKPMQEIQLPQTKEKAIEIALQNNPSLLVSNYNIKLANATKNVTESSFYPKVDVEVSQNFNKNLSAIKGKEEKFRAMIYLSYNIFNGFKDQSSYKKSLKEIEKEASKQEKIKREILQNINTSWSTNEKLQEQLFRLEEYKKFANKTLQLYRKEYDLGRRSLLDLLSAQNDFIGSKAQIINTTYNILYAKYHILNAMGTLVSTLLKEDDAIYNNVDLR